MESTTQQRDQESTSQQRANVQDIIEQIEAAAAANSGKDLAQDLIEKIEAAANSGKDLAQDFAAPLVEAAAKVLVADKFAGSSADQLEDPLAIETAEEASAAAAGGDLDETASEKTLVVRQKKKKYVKKKLAFYFQSLDG